MRIAMIGPKRIPSREGGIDVVVGKLAAGLSGNGNDVTIFVRKKQNMTSPAEYQGCRIQEVPTIDQKSSDALVASLLATIRGLLGKYDILHFHALGNTCFLFLTAFSRKKIVVTIHGLDWKRSKFSGLGSKVLKFAERQVVRYADEIITLCENDRNYFRDTYQLETHLIPNGFERWPLTIPSQIQHKYGLGKEDYLLFLSRVVPEKGLHYLIEAYNQIDIPQKLVIAGGNSHSDDYYQQMRGLAANNDKIIFTGFVEGQLLEELFSNTYLYVLPSDIEGMPMSLLEALGHYRICLVSDIPENRIDPENSYFFTKGSVESLKEALLNISKNRKEYQLNRNLPDWNRVVEQTLDVYKGVLHA